MMQMDDRERTGMVLFDQLEWRNTAEGNAAAWDAEGWYGGDNNKVWLRSEGERVAGTTQNARADLLVGPHLRALVECAGRGTPGFRRRPGAHLGGDRRPGTRALLVQHRGDVLCR